jgi:hypothetical protein
MEKLSEVIYYIIKLYPQKLDRKNLSKLLYFSDGVFFQHHGKLLTHEPYIHLEEVPSPINMNLAIMNLMSSSDLTVEVDFTTLGQKFNRFFLRINKEMPVKLEREEKRIINKVLKAFKSGIIDEDRQYPNLYENYIITPIYGEIKFTKERINTKIQISKKKSLLNLSGKIFRVLFES